MRKMLFLAALVLTVSSYGSAPRGILNIEIKSTKPIQNYSVSKGVTPIASVIPTWLRVKNGPSQSLSLRYPDELSGQWKKVSFSFVPAANDTCILSIGTIFNGQSRLHPYLHIDKVEFQGTTLKNPGFEEVNAAGIPLNWKGKKNASGDKNAFEGKKYARVSYPAPVSQAFKVKKGQKVVFSFHVRQENPLKSSRGADGMTNVYTDCDGTQVHISSGRLTLVPSFENCSYYINRTKAEWGEKCTVKVWYRKKGAKNWIPVLDPVDMEREKAWRGSIMLLQENTLYEFKAVISGKNKSELLREFRTGSSNFKVGRTIILNEKNFKGVLKKIVSGTPNGYTLYKSAPGFVLKGRRNHTGGVIECQDVRYVIFDGLTIDANGSRHGISFTNCENVVVRNCDISNFGLFENIRDMKQRGRWIFKGHYTNYDSGVLLSGGKNQLVERCYIHNPFSTANAWFYSHPAGPTAVCADRIKGGTVIRYNDFVGTDARRWNDALESIGNGLVNGGFGRDADIYGNLFAYANDDCIEIEGGEMNVRVYYNRFLGALSGVSTGSCRLGPSYQYRNVYYKLYEENGYSGRSFKNSHGNQGDGAIFIMNNSVFSPNSYNGLGSFHSERPAYNPPLKMFTRNNIITTSGPTVLDKRLLGYNMDLNYDLFHANIPDFRKTNTELAKYLKQEKNAIYADPRYVDAQNGDLRLQKDSPARNRAAKIPGLPVKHLGAFQDDGIDIPHRPIPVVLDKKEVNFVSGKTAASFKVTMKAAGKGFNSAFKVHCNDNFFTVSPSQGKIKSGESVTFTVQLNSKNIKTARRHNGMAVIRFADGYSRPLVVFADFREDKVLKAANRKNLIFIKDLKRIKDSYRGTVTVPKKGCYFLFADLRDPQLTATRVAVSIGKFKTDSTARFMAANPGLGMLFFGSKTGWYFFLDKGTYPFTFTKQRNKNFDVKAFFLTSIPEEILR